MRSTYEEHQLIAYGETLMPQMGENLQAHVASHRQFMGTATYISGWGEDAKRRLLAHTENTMIELQKFMEQQVIPQVPPQITQPQMMGQPQGGPPQIGPPPQPQGAAPTPEGQVRSNAASIAPRTPREQ